MEEERFPTTNSVFKSHFFLKNHSLKMSNLMVCSSSSSKTQRKVLAMLKKRQCCAIVSPSSFVDISTPLPPLFYTFRAFSPFPSIVRIRIFTPASSPPPSSPPSPTLPPTLPPFISLPACRLGTPVEDEASGLKRGKGSTRSSHTQAQIRRRHLT